MLNGRSSVIGGLPLLIYVIFLYTISLIANASAMLGGVS